jgi:hypothetical protein
MYYSKAGDNKASLESSLNNAGPTTRTVGLYLRDHPGGATREQISRETRISIELVDQALFKLKSMGLLSFWATWHYELMDCRRAF